MRARRAIPLGLVGCAVVAATVGVGVTRVSSHEPPRTVAAPAGARLASATPTPSPSTDREDRAVQVSRSVPRTGPGVHLICPTRRDPGCARSFIRHDAGRRVHPLYGYASCHTGIDLRGRYGDKIRAAAAGRVVTVVHGDPVYGNYTVVQHNATVRTMYAHQSRIRVTPGERVDYGQVIGRVGATGFATGPHLHFEVHVDGRPYDPAGWFGGRKRPVACYTGRAY